MAHPGRYLIPPWRPAIALSLLGAAAALRLTAAPPEPELSVRFSVFSSVPVEGLGFVPQPDAALVPVAFYPTARSRSYDYRGSNPLRFQRVSAKDRATAGESGVAAEIVLPPALHDVLLLFAPILPAPAEGPVYRVYVLDDGAARHAPGGLVIINLGGLTLTGAIGEKPVTLRNGLNPPVAIGRSARIVLRTPFKDRSYQSYADTVELAPGERALLILFPPFRAGSPEVQSRLLLDKPVGDGDAVRKR